jgi:hypothetical protein
MDSYLIKGSIGMPRGSLLRVDDGAGVLVHVWQGEVWLTEEGSERDLVLTAGQWHRLNRDGAALLQSFQRSVLGLSAAEPWTGARRVELRRAGTEPVVLHRAGRTQPWQALRRLVAACFRRIRGRRPDRRQPFRATGVVHVMAA